MRNLPRACIFAAGAFSPGSWHRPGLKTRGYISHDCSPPLSFQDLAKIDETAVRSAVCPRAISCPAAP